MQIGAKTQIWMEESRCRIVDVQYLQNWSGVFGGEDAPEAILWGRDEWVFSKATLSFTTSQSGFAKLF
jgi:hypothetical protein